MNCLKKKEGHHGQNICKEKKMNKDDLLNINPNNKKDFKKILIYGAVVFLIFVIGVISYAIYKNMNPSKEESILPPQVKQEPLFKQVPIENNTTNSLQTNVKPVNVQPKPAQENIKQQLLSSEENNNTNQNQTQKTVTKTPLATPVKTVSKPKKEVKKNTKHYYIQVAALLKYKKPSNKFLKLIEKYGYKYRFYTTFIKKGNQKIRVRKILVGPFDRKEAKKNLSKVKKYITQNAFIFKVK